MSALATCHIKSPIVPRTRLIKKKSRIAVRANYKLPSLHPVVIKPLSVTMKHTF